MLNFKSFSLLLKVFIRYLLGSVFLGLPTSILVDNVMRHPRSSFRAAFWTESFFFGIALVYSGYGFWLCTTTGEGAQANGGFSLSDLVRPPTILQNTVLIMIGAIWSFFGLIFITVIMQSIPMQMFQMCCGNKK